MGSPSFIPTFSMAQFAQAVAMPYTSFDAYRSGIIDSQGNLKKPESSIDPFEYFIIKLKKIFEEIPPTITRSKLSSYNSAFQLFSEEAKTFGIPFDHFLFFVEGYLSSKFLLNEDMGAGAGGGMATGISPGDIGVPQDFKNVGTIAGYEKPLGSPMFNRGPVEMFDMDQNEFDQFKSAKAWKNLPDSATKKYLQRFQRRNPTGRMGIRTKRDNGESDLYWITYPAKSFMEEFGLEELDILNEENKSMIDQYNDADDSTGKPSVATKTDDQELMSVGKKTMITLSANIKSNKEIENAGSLFQGQEIAGANTAREASMLKAITDKMIAAGYKHKADVTDRTQLGIGEFGVFPEGNTEGHSDIHVGMEHPEKKGQVHHLGIESGYNKKRQKQFLIPRNTQIPLSPFLNKLGLKQTSTNVSTRAPQIDVGQEVIRGGVRSESGKRYDLWKALNANLSKYSKKTIERVKQRFRPSAYDAVRTKSDDISIMGDERRTAVVHHREAESVERKLAQQLLDQIGLHHTHDLEDLTFGRSPFYGGSTTKKSTKPKSSK